MNSIVRSAGSGLALALLMLGSTTVDASAQGRGNREREAESSVGVTLSIGVKSQILEFYAGRSQPSLEALPPGIRRRLERGKALPPGIAKRPAPLELQGRIELADGFELVEVGLDVFLVEVATNIIHDVLMDVIR